MTDPVRTEAERLISRYEHANGVSVSLFASTEQMNTYVLLIVGVKPSVQELIVGAQHELEKMMIATLASVGNGKGGVN